MEVPPLPPPPPPPPRGTDLTLSMFRVHQLHLDLSLTNWNGVATYQQAWDFSADFRGFWNSGEILFFFFFFLIQNFTLECIKTTVFDTRNPKRSYCGRGGKQAPLPHPPPAQSLRSLDTRSIRSLAKLSSPFWNISCLIPVSNMLNFMQMRYAVPFRLDEVWL